MDAMFFCEAEQTLFASFSGKRRLCGPIDGLFLGQAQTRKGWGRKKGALAKLRNAFWLFFWEKEYVFGPIDWSTRVRITKDVSSASQKKGDGL
jgi:hypothetical protein